MKKYVLAMAVAIVTATVVSAQKDDSDSKITVSIHQTDQEDGYEGSAEQRCGIRFNLPMTGVTKIEVESVDGLPLAGTAITRQDAQGRTVIGDMAHTSTIITYTSTEKTGFTPGKDYYISTLPCNLYGGYRFSIYKDGLVAHYFGVHQQVESGRFISPDDLVESELEFDKPGAPLVEKGRPKMDSKTHKLFVLYRKNPTEANRQALLDQMGVRYDKVVARKKNKLRELEREARTTALWNTCRALLMRWWRTGKHESGSSSSVSSTPEGTIIRRMRGWCCAGLLMQRLISGMLPSPMPSMLPLNPVSLTNQGRTIIR